MTQLFHRILLRVRSHITSVLVAYFMCSLGLMISVATANGDSDPETTPMPVPERLFQPTLPAAPSAADVGAQDYWLNCMPCHGDQGQGLTDEFRMLYPLDHQNCWESGCHGERPYENGWTLPNEVPALIGQSTLSNYPSSEILLAFVEVAMPFEDPGSLSAEVYMRIIEFLERENARLSNSEPSQAEKVVLHDVDPADDVADPTVTIQAPHANESDRTSLIGPNLFLAILGMLAAALVGASVLVRRSR